MKQFELKESKSIEQITKGKNHEQRSKQQEKS
jgi:hypothetical protein